MRQAGAKAVFGRARSAWPKTARRLASWSWKLRIAFGALCEEDICGGPSPKPTNFLRHGHEASRRSGPPPLEFSETRVGPSSLEFSGTRPTLQRSEPCPIEFSGTRPTLQRYFSGPNPLATNLLRHGLDFSGPNPLATNFLRHGPDFSGLDSLATNFLSQHGVFDSHRVNRNAAPKK